MKKILLVITMLIICFSFRPGQPNEYGKWQMFYKLNHDNFIQVGEERKMVIEWQNYALDTEQRNLYKKFCFYSPDSMYFLDLDSYSVNLKKETDGSLSWTAAHPESKVELVNTRDYSATILLSFGTNGFPETAFWRGQNWFVICGFTKNEKEEFVPTTWWYDLTKKTYTEFQNTKTFTALEKRYTTDVRLAGIPQKK